MSWMLMGSAPMDGTPILGVDMTGDVVACFYSEDEDQWLTFDDFSEPFGPILWMTLEDLPDEESDLWQTALEEFELAVREDEEKWNRLSTKQYPAPADYDE